MISFFQYHQHCAGREQSQSRKYLYSLYGHNPQELVNIEQYQSQSNEYFSTGIMEMFVEDRYLQ